MKKRLSGVLAVVALLGAGSLMTGCQAPFSVTVSYPVDQTFQMTDFLSGLLAGTELPAQFSSPTVPICTIPTMDELTTMAAKAIPGISSFVSMVHLKTVELLEANITAESGDFNSLTLLQVFWQPRGTTEAADRLDLGTAQSDAGLGASFVLAPAAGVNFLDILNAGASPPSDCPKLGVHLVGNVPQANLSWKIAIKFRVTGNIGGS